MKIPLISSLSRYIPESRGPDSLTFSTETYRFTKQDAQKIYDMVLAGSIHESAGKEVALLENEFAGFHQVSHAYATSSGTAALELALRAISLGPGDEVIVPAYTLVATANAVLQCGGVPVFADIDDTFTISPESIRSVISKRTKAIIAVHMFGNIADMSKITEIAKQRNLYVIEDCCQAVGAKYYNKRVGTLGDIGCFSFSAGKAIFTGEGGMILAANKKIDERLYHVKHELEYLHAKKKDMQSYVSMYRMTEMQASLARSILSQLDDLNDHRRNNYNLLISTIGLNPYRIVPGATPSFSRVVWMVKSKNSTITRDTFITRMNLYGIPMKTYYPYPLYSFSVFRKKFDKVLDSSAPFSFNTSVCYTHKKLPFVEKFCKYQVGLSFSPYWTKKHIKYISKHFNSTLGESHA